MAEPNKSVETSTKHCILVAASLAKQRIEEQAVRYSRIAISAMIDTN